MKSRATRPASVGEVEIDARRLRRQGALPHPQGRGGHATRRTSARARSRPSGRAEVAGSHKKPWKQKHTGRARAGDRKSPHLARRRHGLRAQAARLLLPHAGQGAARGAALARIAGKLADGEVVVVDLAGYRAPSAKAARKVLADLGSRRDRRAACVADRRARRRTCGSRSATSPASRCAPPPSCAPTTCVAGGLIIAESGALEALAAARRHAGAADAPATEPSPTEPTDDAASTAVPGDPEAGHHREGDRRHRRRATPTTSACPLDANKVEIRQAVEKLFEVRGGRRSTRCARTRQVAPPRLERRHDPGLEEGHGDAARGRHDRDPLASAARNDSHGNQELQADLGRTPPRQRPGLRRDHAQRRRRSACCARCKQDRRPQQPRRIRPRAAAAAATSARTA